MNLIDRLFAWLWDRGGERRREHGARLVGTARKIQRNRQERESAMAQIRSTQSLARDRQKQGPR